MKKIYKFISTSIITGIFFLIPIGIIIIIFEKIFKIISKLQVALHLYIAGEEHAFLNDLLVVLLLIIICFLAGLAAKLKWGKRLVEALENNVLQHLPGYDYTKATAQGIFGISEHRFSDVILYRDDAGKFALAFKVEAVTDLMTVVFIPSTPKAKDGEMLIVNNKRITPTDLTTQQAFALIRSIGNGASVKLAKYLNEQKANEEND